MKPTWYGVLYNISPFFFHNITFQEFLFCLWNAFKTTYWWYCETKYLRIFCKKPGSWQQLGEKLGDGTLSPLSPDCDPRSRSSSQPVFPEFHFLICKCEVCIRSLWRSCQTCSARISYGGVNSSRHSPNDNLDTPGHTVPCAYQATSVSGTVRPRQWHSEFFKNNLNISYLLFLKTVGLRP